PEGQPPHPGADPGGRRQEGAGVRTERGEAGLMAEDEQTAVAEAPPVARLKQRYEDEIRSKLQDEFGYASVMQHPKLEKITLSMGVGEAKSNSKALDHAMEQLEIIAGQKPCITRARLSIAQFKLREG